MSAIATNSSVCKIDGKPGDAAVPMPAKRRGGRSPKPFSAVLAQVERQANGCWLWTGRITWSGYGWTGFEGRSRPAHRVIYEQLVWPVGPGLELDHLCRNRACCNPMHLEEVTHLENVRRGTRHRRNVSADVELDPAPDEGVSIWFAIYLRRLERKRREKEEADGE